MAQVVTNKHLTVGFEPVLNTRATSEAVIMVVDADGVGHEVHWSAQEAIQMGVNLIRQAQKHLDLKNAREVALVVPG
jgi:isocitrate dehydrogenase